ncbi:MAG: hypothetical protein ACTSXK_00740 [Promethearchaeota archaeon]
MSLSDVFRQATHYTNERSDVRIINMCLSEVFVREFGDFSQENPG